MATLFPNTWEGLVAFYNFMLVDRGISMPDHLVPVAQGIMDERIRKLLVTIGPGSGKSLLISTVAPAFRLGQDPTITQLGISAGEGLMQDFQRGVMEWVSDSMRWRRAFPLVTPDRKAGWSTAKGMFVTGHNKGDSDATYAAFGIDSKKLTGKHARSITLDDVHDKENSADSEACSKIKKIYYNTIIGRADPRGCKFIAAGRRWHTDDLYGHLAESGDWVHMNLPAFRDGEQGLYWDITMPKDFDCCFSNDNDPRGFRLYA